MCHPGTAAPPRRGPRRGLRLVGLVPLPEREVARVALAARVGVLGGLHVVDLLAGELAVRRPRGDVEVDVPGVVGRGVGVPALDQDGDQLDHLRNVPGRRRLVGRREHVQRVVGTVELALHVVGEVVPGATLLGRLDQDLVVDVGDVADEGDVVAARLQPAPQHVEVDRRADVADVGLGLHRQAAHVEARPALLEGDEVADSAGGGVVEPESHPESLGLRGPVPDRPGARPTRSANVSKSDSCDAKQLLWPDETATAPATRPGRRGRPGGPDRSRTRDILITSEALYQLSYTGEVVSGSPTTRRHRR